MIRKDLAVMLPYFDELRMDRAGQLMRFLSLTVAAIAEKLCYSDRRFKRRWRSTTYCKHESPLELQEKQNPGECIELEPTQGETGRLGIGHWEVKGGSTYVRKAFNEYQHEGAVKFLPELRKLLAEGKQKEAEELASREFMSLPLRQLAYGDSVIDLKPAKGETVRLNGAMVERK